MGRTAGHGAPPIGRCNGCKMPFGDSRGAVRTGKAKRDHRSLKRRGHKRLAYDRALASLDHFHEYACRCGHVGWTNHADVFKAPLAQARA